MGDDLIRSLGGPPPLTSLPDAPRLRRGKVVDRRPGAVRVELADRDGMVSHWLRLLAPLATGDAVQMTPPLGTPVEVLTDERGEAGVVLGAAYSDSNPPPLSNLEQILLTLAAGVTLLIDRAGPHLTLTVGPCTLDMGPQGVKITAPRIDLN
jgi:phage baseplate assembly protein gpV